MACAPFVVRGPALTQPPLRRRGVPVCALGPVPLGNALARSNIPPGVKALAHRTHDRRARWAWSWLGALAVITALVVAGARLGGSGVRSMGRRPNTVRVGGLLHTLVGARLVDGGVAGCVPRSAPEPGCVALRIIRANATQADAAASTGSLSLRAPDGARYSPLGVSSIRCPRDACEVLEPGEAREDEVIYLVPLREIRAFELEIEAAAGEAGPPRARVPLW